ncbi:hypothetical protein AB1Y20_009017 [Prymnesium parvum]|uniref:Acyl-CoA thioesterase-like N-terminal HotDog domain-containing protein n=1 Tax=Prymnesium parvum TaxID=97485 RepID=A0AB34K076_PRYPA
MPRAAFNLLALQRLHRSARGVYRTRISHSFDIGGEPNRGYLSFVAGLAMGRTAAEISLEAEAEAKHSQLISMHASFSSSTRGNAEAVIEVEALRTSRSTSTLLARLLQDDKLCACFTGIYGDHTALDGGSGFELPAPELPASSACMSAMPHLMKSMEGLRSLGQLRANISH